jgi:hypothetical protein
MAQERTMKSAEDRASASLPLAPPSRLRLRLSTLDDVRAELARLYREGKSGRRDITDVSKLANVLAILGRLIEGASLEDRIEELERLEAQRGATWSARH